MQKQTKPILLFNDECRVCRRIARWVHNSAQQGTSGEPSIIERPIGDDPEALRLLNADLDIWDAYETIHLLMPDGSMRLGGEAVAEVLRNLHNARWFAWSFAVSIFGLRPFQSLLNIAYAILAGVRPLLGCESCGEPGLWLRPARWLIQGTKAAFGASRHSSPTPHFTAISVAATRVLSASKNAAAAPLSR
jgi:predicted DCC family thiol-disulfide oxidoreductase YuxK